MRTKRLLAVVMLVLLASAWMLREAGGRPNPRTIPRPPTTNGGAGLDYTLSEGSPQRGREDAVPRATATPLSAEDLQKVLKRLPPLKDGGEQKPFALREKSLPAPRPGRTVPLAFPPPQKPDAAPSVTGGPLQVLRFSPEGDVPIGPPLSITFSQPMVAVTAHADLAAQGVPVRLTPAPEGAWRWVGTRTLLFAPKGRFPMATEYRVEIPAGAKSATGGVLEKAVTWTFRTPPPEVTSFAPQSGPVALNPLMVAGFDQAIDPAAVLATVKVSAGGQPVALRLATPEEAEKAGHPRPEGVEGQRWLAFRATAPLPADSAVNVAFGPGTPSAEGSRKTAQAQAFSFRTFGPFRVREYRCGYGEECPPGTPFSVIFSNPVDPKSVSKASANIRPEIAGAKISASGEYMNISGPTKGRTTYTVTLDPDLLDIFGQKLGKSEPMTFKVSAAPPMLGAAGGPYVVADPFGIPSFAVFSVNQPKIRVRAFAVEPTDWSAYLEFMRDANDEKMPTPPGHQVMDAIVTANETPDEFVETRIDLRPALKDGFGNLVVIVEATPQPKERYMQRRHTAWVSATQIGLDAAVDASDLYGWATALKDGSPLKDVSLQIVSTNPKIPPTRAVATDAGGLATIPLPTASDGVSLLVARRGADVAILPSSTYYWSSEGWRKVSQNDYLKWFVFDDRKMYRPGEEVHVKGWLRRLGGGKRGDVGALDGVATSIQYVLKDSRGNEVLKGEKKINALGGFDLAFKLPPTMNLGNSNLQLTAVGREVVDNRATYHYIQVQEFRRPEFEVSARSSEGPHFVGGGADVSVQASYYAGGGLPNAEVTWRVTASPGYYTPPGWSNFNFGTWIPWWESRPSEYNPAKAFNGHTDAAGAHHLHLDFVSVDPPRPTSIQAEASVMDVNRQAWNASTGLLVHPADVYVGLRSARTFVEAGKPLKLDAILTTVEGKALAGQSITLEATRHDLDFENGEYVQKTVPVAQTTLQSAAEPVGWTIDTKEGGTYQVRATVTDAKGRKNQSQMTLWVSGGKRPPARGVEQEKVTLIPDKKSYQPGEVAEILVQAPFSPADGLLTLRRSGILETRAFKVEGTSATLKVPIEEAYLPNLYVQVDLVGAAPRATDDGDKKASLPNRPAYATGQINLDIPPNARVLKLKATPKDDALAPGSETSVDLVLHDAAGKPVQGGEVAVVVVDESVLALTSYRVGDPLYTFYADRPEGASDYHQRASVQLINPEDLLRQQEQHTANGRKAMAPKPAGAMPPPAPMAEASAGARNGDDEGGGAPIKVRSNLDPLAVFAPDVPTDASGHATVRIKMPDNLTRYRVMAVAVAGGRQFGADEATITARLPLMVRPSAPRFLNFGDRFKLPVVLQNQTKQPMHVMVATRAANISLYDSSGKAASAVGFGVTIPAEDRVEVLFPAAAQEAGTARFQVGASGPGAADAAEFTLPVWTPATTEAFATYGQIDEGAIMQPVRPPGEVWPQFGGLEVTTSATALQELTDAMIYLQAYPFECAEQLSSRIVSVAALKDVLTAFKAQGLPTAQEMIAVMKRDITRLAAMQNPDGGFGFWKRGESSWPYVSVHVAHALVRAKAKGFEVPQATLERSKAYLRAVEQHIPRWYGHEARRAIIAYALNVRHRMGDNDGARARKLIADGGKEKLSMEAVGWLLPVLHADPASKTELALVLAMVNNRVTETAAAANFVSGYQDGNYLLLWSSHRVDSIMLDSLIEVQPKSDLIPKVVRGLLAHRVKGRWSNTQENAFVLLALDRYFNTYEKVTPNFVARVWLGERFAGEHPFKGRTVDEARIDVPMGWLVEHPGKPDLVLAKDGPGRLYYRIGMQYAPKDLDPPPADHGFTVLRTYEGVDDAKDARKDENGTWHFKAGAKVRVRVTMVAPSRRYHVALVDPLPAGLEAMNPALAVTGSIPQDPNQRASGRWWWWYGTWYEHQNLRDERAEAFASLLWDGVHEYTYLTRATTPGTFVAPPAKAEEMYHPETFGRSAGDRVIVE